MSDRRVSTRASCNEMPDCSKERNAVVADLTVACDDADVGATVVAVGEVISRRTLTTMLTTLLWNKLRKRPSLSHHTTPIDCQLFFFGICCVRLFA